MHGLQSKPALNGLEGIVLRPQGGERWQVRLHDEEETELALRPANLTVVEGIRPGDDGTRGGASSGGGGEGDGDGAAAKAATTARAGRVRLPHTTYSPIRLVLGMLMGTPPDGRGEVFREPWMNAAAVGGASVLFGVIIAAAVAYAMAAADEAVVRMDETRADHLHFGS